jgi:hypothetical protein
MATLELPKPRVEIRDRSITAYYRTGIIEPPTEFETRQKEILLVFQVHYTKAGINYFTGERVTTDYFQPAVRNAKSIEGGGISFVMGSGLGLARIEQPSNRFNRKKLTAIFNEWREKVEGLLSLDEDQLHLLDEDEQKLRAAVLPYWNGTRAGLA